MFLTTDALDPSRKNKLESIDANTLKTLPVDYLDFLDNFGTGTYCDEVYITYPDVENIPLTFADYTDFWDLDENYSVKDLLNSIQIGNTANGDIICVTASRLGNIFVLPRHDTSVISFNSFVDAIKSFVPNTNKTYFDPLYDSQQKQFSLIKPVGGLTAIAPIHELFLQQFSYDFIAHESTQPKYFINKFGGWLSFDLIYKNSITFKYQNQYSDKASGLFNFLKQHVNEN